MGENTVKPFVPVQWQSDLETGIPDVDAQHKTLLALLNEAGAMLEEPDRATLDRLLNGLIAYAQYHFDTEEALMREFRYSEAEPFEAANHLVQHRAFTSRVLAMYDTLKSGGGLDSRELFDFLSNWLSQHIRHTDLLMSRFLALARKRNE